MPKGGTSLFRPLLDMYDPKEYDFSAVLAMTKVRILGKGPHNPYPSFWGSYPPPPSTPLLQATATDTQNPNA